MNQIVETIAETLNTTTVVENSWRMFTVISYLWDWTVYLLQGFGHLFLFLSLPLYTFSLDFFSFLLQPLFFTMATLRLLTPVFGFLTAASCVGIVAGICAAWASESLLRKFRPSAATKHPSLPTIFPASVKMEPSISRSSFPPSSSILGERRPSSSLSTTGIDDLESEVVDLDQAKRFFARLRSISSPPSELNPIADPPELLPEELEEMEFKLQQSFLRKRPAFTFNAVDS